MCLTQTNGDNELQLNWVSTGPDNTSTVVLIHPVGFDLTYWDRQIEALCSGYNVVAFDLPGHGLTSSTGSQKRFWRTTRRSTRRSGTSLRISTSPTGWAKFNVPHLSWWVNLIPARRRLPRPCWLKGLKMREW